MRLMNQHRLAPLESTRSAHTWGGFLWGGRCQAALSGRAHVAGMADALLRSLCPLVFWSLSLVLRCARLTHLRRGKKLALPGH